MVIIEKSQLESYRLAVAKIAFLQTYAPRFSFVENLAGSCMLVRDSDAENAGRSTICVAILQRPPKGKKIDYPITIYYQQRSYTKYLRKVEGGKRAEREGAAIKFDAEVLSPAFDECYENDLETAFTDPQGLFIGAREPITAGTDIMSLFSNVDGSFDNPDEYLDSLMARERSESFRFLYKYRTAKSFEENEYGARSGTLSFSHPMKFNDPFDCNCFFSNGNSAVDKFRILCLAGSYDNILMWSHYGEEHRGYCCEYEFWDIYRTIVSDNTVRGLCIWGAVKYTDKRPQQRSAHGSFTWADIQFYVNASFLKFIDWEYEKEIRFVIISNDPSLGQFHNIVLSQSPTAYMGCNNYNNNQACRWKMEKHPTKYALIRT